MLLLALVGIGVSQPGVMTVKVPHGPELRLVAVTFNGKRWSPGDGSPLSRKHEGFLPDSRSLCFEINYNRKMQEDSASVGFELSPKGPVVHAGTNTIFTGAEDMQRDHWYAYGFFPSDTVSADRADLRVGYADGPWKTASKVFLRNGKVMSRQGGLKVRTVGLTPARNRPKPDVTFAVEIPPEDANKSFRIVALDKNGEPMERHGSMRLAAGPTKYFFGGTLSGLSRIELQTRPYTWVTFKGVHMRPRS